MPELIKDLVDAFNVHNYGSTVDTNLSVEGSNIVVPFYGNVDFGKQYLTFMGEQVRREYFPTESAASAVFHLKSFPFNHAQGRWEQSDSDKEKGVVKFVTPVKKEVISNFKCLFSLELEKIAIRQMVRELIRSCDSSKEEIMEYLEENIKTSVIDRANVVDGKLINYLHCTSFNNEDLMNHFKQKFKEKMKEYNYDFSGLLKIVGTEVYVKDVNFKDVKKVTEKTKELVGRDFEVPSSDDPTVRRYKNAISDLIFRLTEIPIFCYRRDIYLNTSSGEYFAFIPEVKDNDGNIKYLSVDDVNKINAAFGYTVFSNIEGHTIDTQAVKGNGVYALSNRSIALLIPKIIENSAVGKIGNDYGLIINPNLQRHKLKPHSSLEEEPHASVSKFVSSSGSLGAMSKINQRQPHQPGVIQQAANSLHLEIPSSHNLSQDSDSSGFVSRNPSPKTPPRRYSPDLSEPSTPFFIPRASLQNQPPRVQEPVMPPADDGSWEDVSSSVSSKSFAEEERKKAAAKKDNKKECSIV